MITIQINIFQEELAYTTLQNCKNLLSYKDNYMKSG